MKLNLNYLARQNSFSLHQSGTVMKLMLWLTLLGISFSLHQSGTVMKWISQDGKLA